MTDRNSRAIARAAERRYRNRKRIAATLVPLPLTPRQRAGLERLGLVVEGETDREALAAACGRVLDAAEALALAGAALYPGDGDCG